jgi:hypothetical protein
MTLLPHYNYTLYKFVSPTRWSPPVDRTKHVSGVSKAQPIDTVFGQSSRTEPKTYGAHWCVQSKWKDILQPESTIFILTKHNIYLCLFVLDCILPHNLTKSLLCLQTWERELKDVL